MSKTTQWRLPPGRSFGIFLLAVFFIFASFGFASDAMGMGTQGTLRFAVGVCLSGLFAVAYAGSGIALRNQFWKATVPIFVVQFISMTLLAKVMPDVPRAAQLGVAETIRLQHRLTFDGLATILAICLGYAGFVYVSITEGRRYAKTQIEKASLEGEMTAAREVQRVMVPEVLPQVQGYAIESIYRPAAEVGGDFFQVIPLKAGRTLIVLGDVSGKGLRAAMIVSMLVGALRTVTGYTEEPAEILGELNRRLFGRMQDGFATCLAMRLEEAGGFTLANAGHLPPYQNGVEIALAGSLPLGLAESAEYEQTSLAMAVGDAVVLLTDGIAEAQDEARALFGFAQIESMLGAGVGAHMLAEHAHRHGQNDDITVLRVERLV